MTSNAPAPQKSGLDNIELGITIARKVLPKIGMNPVGTQKYWSNYGLEKHNSQVQYMSGKN